LVVGFLGVLSLVNDRGMRESTWVNGVCTVASILALVGLAIAGASHWGEAVPELLEAPLRVPASAMVSAGALSFYAFIGFEDICNVADETREPSRTIPRAILLSLAIATVLYVVVTVSALSVVSADELASHSAPLALVSERLLPSISSRWLAGIAVLAVINTALFNLIMASRVLFGMARNGWLPAQLGAVGARNRTPRRAIAVAFVLAAAFALTGLLGVLAEATNVIILLAFTAVNVALVVIRLRRVPPDADAGRVFRVPIVVPIVGALLTVALLTQLSAGAWLRAAGLVAVGLLGHVIVRRRAL
jgi:amino acid transporter